MKKLKQIPQFKNEKEEADFWSTHDTTEYFDTTTPIKADLLDLKSIIKTTKKPLSNDKLHDMFAHSIVEEYKKKNNLK